MDKKFPLTSLTEEVKGYINHQFKVLKYNPSKRIFSKKTRIWEVDLIAKVFRNMDRKGKVKKTFEYTKLLRVEKGVQEPKKILLSFMGAKHHYELLFENAFERERFYECALAMRLNVLNYVRKYTN